MDQTIWGLVLLGFGALGGWMINGQMAERRRIDHDVRMRHARKACEGYRLLIEGYARSLIVAKEDKHIRLVALHFLRDHAKHIVTMTATEASALDTKTADLAGLVQVVTESLCIDDWETK
jgi:hypothetical protein